MTMTIVAGLLVSPEHRTQEKGAVGHAAFDGRNVTNNAKATPAKLAKD